MELAVLSIFGRGEWLAAAAQKAGMPTTLIDISSQMGIWSPEDWQGPFGYHKFEKEIPYLSERLTNDDESVELAQGFTLFLKDGPLELRGPVPHRLKMLGQSLQTPSRNAAFRNRWLYQFSKSFSCAYDLKHTEDSKDFESFLIQKEFYFSHPTRQGIEACHEWLRKTGVRIIAKAQLQDVILSNRKLIEGVQIQDTQSQPVHFNQMVCCLTHEELAFASAKSAKKLGAEPAQKTMWSWVRARIKIEEHPLRAQVPLQMVIMQNELLPVGHQNGMVLRRTTSPDVFDLWLKISCEQRFDRNYLKSQVDVSYELVQARLGELKVEVKDYPQEFEYTYAQLGPSRFPVFFGTKPLSFQSNLKNLYFSSPETWGRLDLNAMIQSQNVLLEQIVSKWKKQLEDLKRKHLRQATRE